MLQVNSTSEGTRNQKAEDFTECLGVVNMNGSPLTKKSNDSYQESDIVEEILIDVEAEASSCCNIYLEHSFSLDASAGYSIRESH